MHYSAAALATCSHLSFQVSVTTSLWCSLCEVLYWDTVFSVVPLRLSLQCFLKLTVYTLLRKIINRLIHHNISSFLIIFELDQSYVSDAHSYWSLYEATWGHVDSMYCFWCLVQLTVNLRLQEKALLQYTYAVLPHQVFTVLQLIPPYQGNRFAAACSEDQ